MQLGLHLARLTAPGGDPATYGPTLAAPPRGRGGGVPRPLADGPLLPDGDDRPRPSRCSRATRRSATSPARPRRMTLGLLVTGVTYRHPGLLAKTVTTLDVLSGGRALLGIGAAWYEREHLGLGVPFPPMAERFERLEETLQICLQMWSDDDGPFDGQALPARGDRLRAPQPISSPAPADPDRRQRGAEDAAPRRAVRRRLQPLRHARPTRSRTSSTCCAGTATTSAATRRRSRRRSSCGGRPARRTSTTSSTTWRRTPRSASRRWP